MKMNSRIVALAVGLLLVFASGVVWAAEPAHRPGEVIVRVDEGFSRARVDQIALAVGARVSQDLGDGLGFFLLVFDRRIPVSRMIARLERQTGVLYADPNNMIKSDPAFLRLKAEQAAARGEVKRLKLDLAAADQAVAAGQKRMQRAQEAVAEERRNLGEAEKVIKKRLHLDAKRQAALAKVAQRKEESLAAKQALAAVNQQLYEAERAVNRTRKDYDQSLALVLKTALPIDQESRLFGGEKGNVRIVVISTADAAMLKEKKQKLESAIAARKILIAQRKALSLRREGALNDLELAQVQLSDIELQITGAIDKGQAQQAVDKAAVALEAAAKRLQVIVDRQEGRSRRREEVSGQLDASQNRLRDIDRRLAQFWFSAPPNGDRTATEQTIGQVNAVQELLARSPLPAGLQAQETSEMHLSGVDPVGVGEAGSR